eukprot:TRINITY_DN2113_c0_g1_i1.p1 TRINITY_DN2113_c0_g1~~TRINITY_DN2113_c0_g1_i1.p1  ORF type:complete len:452 (-),score=41.24 TRINITY_DN2113_c0_g1_i1:108-1463(-)
MSSEEVMNAASAGDVDRLAVLMATDTDFEKHSAGALSLSLYNGDVPAVRLLLVLGVSVVTVYKELTIAAFGGHERIVLLLLVSGVDIESKDKNGWTPLHCAAFEGCASTVSLLLQHGVDIEAQADSGDSALHWAAFRGHAHVVSLLLASGANFASTIFTPLEASSYKGHTQVVSVLLISGASNDAIAAALNSAVSNGHASTVSLLLAHSTDNVISTSTLYFCLLYCRNSDVAVLVMDATHRNEKVMLMPIDNNVSLLRAALVVGIVFDIADDQGDSLIFKVLRNNRHDIADLLLDAGTDIDGYLGDGQQHTLLTWASFSCYNNNEAIVDFLLERGASVDKPHANGTTALMFAAQAGHKHIVQRLLQCNKINTTVRDNQGRDCVDMAASKEVKSIICQHRDERERLVSIGLRFAEMQLPVLLLVFIYEEMSEVDEVRVSLWKCWEVLNEFGG